MWTETGGIFCREMNSTPWRLGKKHIAQCNARDTANSHILPDTKQVPMGTLQCQAARVVLDVSHHVGELVLPCQYAVVVLLGEEAEPLTLGNSRECPTSIVALQLEPAHILAQMLGQSVMDAQEDVYVVGHDYIIVDFY